MILDYKNPNYPAIFQERADRLAWLRRNPDKVPALRLHYRDHIADYISDWGMTFDPRNIDRDLPAVIPFIPFDKQRDLIEAILDHWRSRRPLIIDKSREVGASWITVAVGASLCMLFDDFVAGYGSRKEEYVDKREDPKSLFYKGRMFVKSIPAEFRPGWDERTHAPHMRIRFPHTGSVMTGEAGDSIGRGDRTSIHFVDESAFLERPLLVDASLSMTTNCRVDTSSANGMGNPFAQKRHNGNIDVFTLHWRDDPRKDEAWYKQKCIDIDNPVIVAQELDINYNASQEGIVIPSEWVQAAIDAHIKLQIRPTGERRGAFDVADEGKDKNAFASGHGIVLDFLDEWSGLGSDVFKSTVRCFGHCDDLGLSTFRYDADGMGGPVRGDARIINEQREAAQRRTVAVQAFRGSAGVVYPLREDVKGRKNEDYFMNFKAQSWNTLRLRFRNTYRAVVEGMEYDPDSIISLDSAALGKMLTKLTGELSQPTWGPNVIGKMVVDKTPDDTKSPNLADAVMMLYAPLPAPLRISQGLLEAI